MSVMPTAAAAMRQKDSSTVPGSVPEQRNGHVQQQHELVVCVLGLPSSARRQPSPTDSSASSLVNGRNAPGSGKRSGVGRSTLIASVLGLNGQPGSDSALGRQHADTTASSERGRQDDPTLFATTGASYLYHGWVERTMAKKATSPQAAVARRKLQDPKSTSGELCVKLHVIELVDTVSTPTDDSTAPKARSRKSPPPLPAETSQSAVGGATARPTLRPKPVVKPKIMAVKPHASPKPRAYSAAVDRKDPQPTSLGTSAAGVSPSPSLTPSRTNDGVDRQQVASKDERTKDAVAQLKDGTMQVGAYILVVDATADQAVLQEQRKYFLDLQKSMLATAQPAAAVLISTKNDVMKNAELARQHELWAEDLGREIDVTQCYHVSCKPQPIGISFSLDSLIAMTLGGEMPEGDTSFVKLRANHQQFMKLATNLASLLATSQPEPYLSWRAWKDCGGASEAQYQSLLASDQLLGEQLARCLHRHRVLQRVFAGHVMCCFSGDASRVSQILTTLSVGKRTPDELEAVFEGENGHRLWKKVKNLPVLSKPVPPSAACLHSVVVTVTKNCTPPEDCPQLTRGERPKMSTAVDDELSDGDYVDIASIMAADADASPVPDAAPATSVPDAPEEAARESSGDDECYQYMHSGTHNASMTVADLKRARMTCSEDGDNVRGEHGGMRAPPLPGYQKGKAVVMPSSRARIASAPTEVAGSPQKVPTCYEVRSLPLVSESITSPINSNDDDDDPFGLVTSHDNDTNGDYSYTWLPYMCPDSPGRAAPATQFEERRHRRHNAMRITLRPRMPEPGESRRRNKPDGEKYSSVLPDRLKTAPRGSRGLAASPTYGRQVSRSLEDLRALYEDIPLRRSANVDAALGEFQPYENLPLTYQRVSAGVLQAFPTNGSHHDKQSAAATPAPSAAQQPRPSRPLENSSSSALAQSRHVSLKGVKTIESGKTMLRLAARHPTIDTAWFNVNISVDVHTPGWEKALADLKEAGEISLSIRK